MHSAKGILPTTGVFRYFTTILSFRETTQSTNDGNSFLNTHKRPSFLSLGLEKSWFPILLPKSNSAFRDASSLTHVIITFIFLIKVYSDGSRVILKEFLPLHPGELVMSPDWTASLKWREQAVTTGQGGTAGSALGCCLMSWPESCSPLFSCLPLLSIHPKLLGTETLMGIQRIHLKWILANQLLFYYS